LEHSANSHTRAPESGTPLSASDKEAQRYSRLPLVKYYNKLVYTLVLCLRI